MMALFGKKSVDEERLEYIAFIKKMSSTCDLLIKYAEDTEHYDKMLPFGDEVKYFLPIDKLVIKDIDKKINNTLGDLKILLYTNRDPYRVEGKINDLKKLCAERNTKI